MDTPDHSRRYGPNRDVTVLNPVHRADLLPEDDLRSRYSSDRLGRDEFDDDRGIDILHLLGIFLKYRWLIIGTALAFLLGGVVLTFLMTPIYRAGATIQIDQTVPTVVEVQGVQAIETDSASFYQTQFEQLKSRALASRVVANLNLTEDARFLGAASPSVITKIRDLLFDEPAPSQEGYEPNSDVAQSPTAEAGATSTADATTAPSENGPFGRVSAVAERAWEGISSVWQRLGSLVYDMSAPASSPKDLDVDQRRAIAVARLTNGLTVEPVGTSRIVRLIYESTDPKVAAQIANAVAESYINRNLEQRYEASSYARTFLQERLQEIKLKLEESEKELVEYARKQGIVDVNDQAASLVASEYAAADQALADATTARIRAEEAWRQAQATSGFGVAAASGDSGIALLREERARLTGEYEQKLSSLRPNHPEMLGLKEQIARLDRLIFGEKGLVAAELEAAYQAALAIEKAREERLASIKNKILDFQDDNIQYKILLREVDTNNELYQGLLQRYKEIGVSGGIGTNNVSIVDPALAPSGPFKPNVPRNLALALMLGLVAGAAGAFALNFFDDAIKSAEEIEQALGMAVIGVLPLKSGSNVGRFIADFPRSGLAEAVKSLSTTLQFSTATGAPRSLLVTSPRAGEGKSTISVSVARSFAKIGMRVLIIDGDLRDPSLDDELRQSGDPASTDRPGLTDYLIGAKDFADIVQPTEIETLFYVPTGRLPPNPADLLAGPKMHQLIRTAEEEFDIVIIDGPPVMGLADAPLLASVTNETLLVIAANQSRRGASQAALKRLQLARARILGAVLNKFDHRKVGFSYGYGYGYGYGDQYGYGTTRLAPGEGNNRG